MSQPHLTEAMRDAAYRYANRMVKEGIDRAMALEEGKKLARQGLLASDGSLKPRKRPGARTSSGRGRAPKDRSVSAAERGALRRISPKANGVTLAHDDKGFYVHTHRARSKSYENVEDIPAGVIREIESTG